METNRLCLPQPAARTKQKGEDCSSPFLVQIKLIELELESQSQPHVEWQAEALIQRG